MSDIHLIRAHQSWLGFLQQQGLVVAPRALVDAQAILETNAIADQRRLEALLLPGKDEDEKVLPPFAKFATEFLGWDSAALVFTPDLPDRLDVVLPDFDETLRPSCAVRDPESADPNAWLLLVSEEKAGVDLDKPNDEAGHRKWHASPQARFERLLRETGVPIGLLTSGALLRLVYAPKGESTGHLTFPISILTGTAGRESVAALVLLLDREHLFAGPIPENRRLPALLRSSRKYQNDVSEELAEQVLDALWELLRGFQSANEATKGELLREVLEKEPQAIYGGLLGTLMRLVFILYAEDRGLMPQGEVYAKNYSIGGLFERLRDDHATFPETMDQRYGAWAHLLTLFRLIHDGGAHGDLKLPPRHGHLFDPDTWDFLEGRPYGDRLNRGEAIETPKVPDSTIYRVLAKMIFLEGERISYRTLDVEEIGSVYEAMMGFELREAAGPSVAVKPKDIVVDLHRVIAEKPEARARWLAEEAECKVEGKVPAAVKAASSVADLVAALGKKLSRRTPVPVPTGGLFLQPTAERRRSGSHYTPRSLTKPIVETTLKPLLAGLSHPPKPGELLALKVCDPAMGSGAFLVETCRYLAEALVDAWRVYGGMPPVPPDEDPLVHARRLVATRCLYGVDKNPFAVDLAKLSLWLATLAKDHPFTFLDHALRHGDSLVGLTRAQIAAFHWLPEKQIPLVSQFLERAIETVEKKRAAIHALGDAGDTGEKARLHEEASAALANVRRAGDLVIVAFFEEDNAKKRNLARQKYADEFVRVLEGKADPGPLDLVLKDLYQADRPVPPFHWEMEFPEVFSRPTSGFDAFVGNPPFAGKNTLAGSTREAYPDWLKLAHAESHGNADLVAHFCRRAFNLLRQGGAMGLIATNTIAQGDTRSTGLRWICMNGGAIFNARKRYKWPGKAAVIVSVIHIAKGVGADPAAFEPFLLDGREVPRITAFLFHDGGHANPATLLANDGKSFIGSYVLGMGFTFDDTNPDASPIAEMHRLIAKDPRNAQRIYPYIGGEEVNDSPTHQHRRYVINFEDFPLCRADVDGASWVSADEGQRKVWLHTGEVPLDYADAVAADWSDLLPIIERKVKPQRLAQGDENGRRLWWRFLRTRPELYAAIQGLDRGRCLACSQISKYTAFTFLPTGYVFTHNLVLLPFASFAAFGAVQSRVHLAWSAFFGASFEDRPIYTPSDCFETFPFPSAWESDAALESAGREYESFRAALMVRNGEGLTDTYNRFHQRDEVDPDILKLRDLHDAMDRAVLDAYGWTDLHPTCDFFRDYEEQESDDPAAPKSKKKEPLRYRWPDAFRDEILARLLALNAERAAEEKAAEATNPKTESSKGKSKKGPKAAKSTPGSMFDDEAS